MVRYHFVFHFLINIHIYYLELGVLTLDGVRLDHQAFRLKFKILLNDMSRILTQDVTYSGALQLSV